MVFYISLHTRNQAYDIKSAISRYGDKEDAVGVM